MEEKEQRMPAARAGSAGESEYWTRNRQELLEWMSSHSPSLAELYKGAFMLLFDAPVPGFTRFVSHAVREIRNRLPGVITGSLSAGHLEYKGRMDDIASDWKKAGVVVEAQVTGDASVPSGAHGGAQDVVLPRKLARKIGELVADHDAAREKPRDAAIRLFEGVAPRNQRFRDAVRPVVLQWMQVCDWFMARTHESSAKDDDIDLVELRKNFELFESTLLAIVRAVSTFFANTDELDAILKEEPTPDNVEAAIARMGHGEYNRYFFDRLENPGWIQPLKAKKFFSSPPTPVRDDIRGTIAFAPWPESRYLLRMAGRVPAEVLAVALSVPDTENVRVHDDLADIALALPGPLAARLVPQAKRWIETPYRILLPEKLGAFVTKLVKEGEADAALDLAGALLEVLPDLHPVLVPEPVGHFDSWHYERILAKDMPALVAIVGMPAFALLSDLLDTAVRLGQQDANEGDPEDYSFVWRPAIEHGRGYSRGVADGLVSAVLDAATQLVARKLATVREVVLAVEKRRRRVFHRIALHVLRLFGDQEPELVAERLREPVRYDHAGITREYWLLAGSQFAQLNDADKGRVLDWIGAGPDLERFRKRWEEITGQPVSEEDAVRYGKEWRRDRLAVLQDGLPDDLKVRYEQLVAEMGPARDLTQVHGTTGGAFAPPSPKAEADLSTMGIGEIIEYLKSWQPSGEPLGEKMAGLAGQLAGAVGSDPVRFGAAAQKFKGLDPTYVREFLQALREPAKKRDAFDWREVLALCRWAVDQPRTIPGRIGGLFDRDPDWSWTRSAIARLLSSGFEADSLPMERRVETWEILEKLTEDSDPTVEDEARYLGDRNSDPSSLSINSIRGEAMHGVVQYALWVRRDLEKRPDAEALVPRGFEEMPEVRRILERRLDPEVDSTLTTRSVYGRWLPWLQFLDGKWFEQHLEKIFPVDEKMQGLRDCAWTTYVVHCDLYNDVFKVLHREYRSAIERIGEHATGRSDLGDPDVCLGNHLMVLYWRGNLPLPREAGLLEQFYAKAPDKLRGSAAGFIGRTLKNDTGEVSLTVIERLKALWLARLDAARAAGGNASFQEELSQFGWWFVSKKFNDEWSIDQLLATLKIARKIEPDLWVVERLRELGSTMPGKAVECLTLMVDGDEEGWGMLGWRGDAWKVLEAAINYADPGTRQLARELIHKLGGRGYFEFRELLAGDPQ